MYKNQLQELAQRSCFNLPAYTCLREGPDHAPRFKAAVNFNGEQFESPGFFTTLRQAEHAAAEVALAALAQRGPSYSLAARILVSRPPAPPRPPLLLHRRPLPLASVRTVSPLLLFLGVLVAVVLRVSSASRGGIWGICWGFFSTFRRSLVDRSKHFAPAICYKICVGDSVARLSRLRLLLGEKGRGV